MSGDINDYPVRILVAGSRSFNDYRYFRHQMEYRLELLRRSVAKEHICFISGVASRGADAMIVRWCQENGYPCFEYPADWDQFGKRAGMLRNTEMSTICTFAIVFWDKVSNGTKHMFRLLLRKKIPFVLYSTKIIRGQDGRKPKESGADCSEHAGRVSTR